MVDASAQDTDVALQQNSSNFKARPCFSSQFDHVWPILIYFRAIFEPDCGRLEHLTEGFMP